MDSTAIQTAVIGGMFGVLAAIISAVVAIFVANKESRRMSEQVAAEARRASDQLRADMHQAAFSFTQKLVDERLRTYGPVFSLLGVVPDWAKGRMQPIPDKDLVIELQTHLYGPAGLVMSYQSRNALLAVIDHLIHGRVKERRAAFFVARRYLWADLQLSDVPEVRGEVEQAIQRALSSET